MRKLQKEKGMDEEAYLKRLENEICEFKSGQNPIVIFGTMSMGQIAYKVARFFEKKVVAFCDNNRKSGQKIEGLPFFSVEELKKNVENPIIYICSFQKKNIAAIKAQLEQAGFQRVKTFEVLLYLYRFEIKQNELKPKDFAKTMCALYYEEDRLILRNLGTFITQRCSLRCENCGALINHYQRPVHYETKEIIESLKQVSLSVDAIESLGIYGGEPFLHPELTEICRFASSLPNVKNISVITNGTIVPKEEVFQCFYDLGIPITISDYGPELSRKKEELVEKLEEWDIPYECFSQEQDWYECRLPQKYGRSDEENERYYQKCFIAKKCPVIQGGKLYICGYHASSVATGYYKEDKDCVNLCDESLTAKEKYDAIRELYEKPFIEICDYCSLCEEHIVKRAKQKIIQYR